MKKILTFIALLGMATAYGQSKTDIGKIMLSVVVPSSMEGLTNAQLTNLELKCAHIATGNGLAAAGYGDFILTPKLTINETNVADGGMKQITVVNAELALFVMQAGSKVIFSSVTKNIRGSGSSKEAAISNAIAGIKAGDAIYKDFIQSSKEKITVYYGQHCDDIMSKAEALVKRKEYEEAIGMLLSIPDAVKPCYDKAQQQATKVFTAYENQVCSRQIQDARTQIAAGDYAAGLEHLRMVDPACKCSREANELIKATAAKVSAEEKRAWDAVLKIYSDAVALEHHRMNAITEIAVSSYKGKRRR